MTRALLAWIEKTCPTCGSANRIMTTEIRPCWRINCSRCGTRIAERRAFRPVLICSAPLAAEEPPAAG